MSGTVGFYDIPSGESGRAAVSSTVVTVIGGVNQYRKQLTVTNNGPNTLFVMWGVAASPPDATTVANDGQPIGASGGSETFRVSLRSNGNGTTDPTLFGIVAIADQTSPADTRWEESS